ncbi:MAG: hypothetical protein GF313_10940 [Caldithrix sp.]|nr:hypothetical protein [Caldithrix sp.]
MRYVLKFLILSSIVASLILYSCSESTDPHSDDNEHARGIGIRITSSGQSVVEYEGDGTLTGALTVAEGDLSVPYMFMLIDEDGEAYTPEEDHHELRFEVADTTVTTVWQHEGEEGGFEFHLQGKNQGETTVVFSVYHEDHPDFVSRDIPAQVTAANAN